MKYQITSTKLQTNSKYEAPNGSPVAISDFGFDISDFKRLKGAK